MGQKVIPTSLRLGLNRHFDSCYYQEMHYSNLLAKDLSFQSYTQSLFQRIGMSKGRIFSNIAFKKQSTYMFVFPERLNQQIGFKQTRRKQNPFTHELSKQHKYSSNRVPFQSTRFSNISIQINSDIINKHTGQSKTLTPLRASAHSTQMKSFHFQNPQYNLSVLLRSLSKVQNLSDNLFIQKSIIEQMSPSVRSFFLCSPKILPVSGKDFFVVSFLFLIQQLRQSNNNIHSQLFRKQLIQCVSSLCLVLRDNSTEKTLYPNRTVCQLQAWKQYATQQELAYHLADDNSKQTSSPERTNQNIQSDELTAEASWQKRNNKQRSLPLYTKLFQAKISNGLQKIPSLESRVSTFFASSTSLIPLKVPHFEASAHFVAKYFVQQLERKKPFRRIMKQIIAHMKTSSNIKGIRLVCAGRLGGVEMARVESRKWGETSLHVFSNQIDYSAQTAYTVYGLIGVKVWISYDESNDVII